MGQPYQILLGYRLSDGQIFIDEDTAPVIKMIFMKAAVRVTISQICREMENMGLKNRQGNVRWQARGIRDILKEEAYCGRKGYPAIIDEALYSRVQEVRVQMNHHHTCNENEDVMENRRYVYHDKLICEDCGSRFKRMSKGRRYHPNGQPYGSVFWYCPQCRQELEHAGQCYVKVTDMQLREIYKSIVNQMLVCPAIYRNIGGCEQILENKRTDELEQQISELNLQQEEDVSEAIRLCFQLAKERFSLLKLDDREEHTARIEQSLRGLEYPVNEFNKEIFREIVEKIKIRQDGRMHLTMTNGVEMPIYM